MILAFKTLVNILERQEGYIQGQLQPNLKFSIQYLSSILTRAMQPIRTWIYMGLYEEGQILINRFR